MKKLAILLTIIFTYSNFSAQTPGQTHLTF